MSHAGGMGAEEFEALTGRLLEGREVAAADADLVVARVRGVLAQVRVGRVELDSFGWTNGWTVGKAAAPFVLTTSSSTRMTHTTYLRQQTN
jgi:hypothetical protein